MDDISFCIEQVKNGEYKVNISQTETTEKTSQVNNFSTKNSEVEAVSSVAVNSSISANMDLLNTFSSTLGSIDSSVNSSSLLNSSVSQTVSDVNIQSYLNMLLYELNFAKSEKQSELNNTRGNINNLYSSRIGINDAKIAYEEAIANDDSISDELKQKNSTNINDISKKDSIIS